MRELTLLETGYVAGMLLLSLVLPLTGTRAPRGAATKRFCMKLVWIGQALLAVAGLAVLTSASVAPYATAFGVLNCICCTFLLLRQFRAIRPA
jgi:hypothetical protein